MPLDVSSNFKYNFDWNVALFYRIKINNHGVYVIKKKKREDLFDSSLRIGDVLLLTHI